MGETVASTSTREDLIGRARSLAFRLRARAEEGEGLRRMPDDTIADLRSSQLARICQPSRYGGFDEGWDALCEVGLELARGDGSQAWVSVVYGEHACLVGHFPDEAQRDVWGGNEAALISSSYAPGCTAVRVNGGYSLTGQWTFSSGVHHADWTLLGALVPQLAGPPQHTFFLVPAADRTVIDDWYVAGMQGTGSCSFTLNDAFVPEHRTLSSTALNKGDPPGAKVIMRLCSACPYLATPTLPFVPLLSGSQKVWSKIMARFCGRGVVPEFRRLDLESAYPSRRIVGRGQCCATSAAWRGAPIYGETRS